MKQRLVRYWNSFSFVGLVVATLFFAGSVTPSLLPRPYFVQGILSGFSLAIGYCVGWLAVAAWLFFELPQPRAKLEFRAKRIASVCTAIVVAFFLWKATNWQNSIRVLMEMPPAESAYRMRFFVIAILLAVVLIAGARLVVYCCIALGHRLKRFLPRRVAFTISGLVVGFGVVFLFNGVLARVALNVADGFFLRADELIDEDIERPGRAAACGGPDSLVPWESIGRLGKQFINNGPSRESIQALTGRDAMQPIRVYVGMRSRPTIRERAKLAVEELIRDGGFERSVLIVATPTGTGWLDEGAVDPIEYLHDGDTAIVCTQYSYLPSWMTILVDPERSRRSARALFEEVYQHWTTLPKDSRPKLYLHGLSLGSLGAEASADLLTVFEDPIQGGLFSGPPFPSRQWADIVRARNEGTPVWMPTFRDQTIVRFTAQQNHLQSDKRWGPIRNVYIQYASDPMIWFSPDLLFHRPPWLDHPRGPDVSPELRWYPIITFLQTAFDLPLATSVPIGYGHNYAPEHYIDGWVAVTDPEGWDEERIKALKEFFRRDRE